MSASRMSIRSGSLTGEDTTAGAGSLGRGSAGLSRAGAGRQRDGGSAETVEVRRVAYPLGHRGVAQPVARLLWEQEVPSSSLGAPTSLVDVASASTISRF